MTKIIPHILYLITKLLSLTYRMEYRGQENLQNAEENSPQKNFILAVWHQNLLPVFLAHDYRPFTMIVSASKDGDLIAHACELYGHTPSRGSSTRGGKKAMTSMIEIMTQKKVPGAITVDGPVGPAFKAKKGVVEIAYQAGAWIVPVSSYASRFWSFNSWDNFRLPKPFCKIVIYYSPPIPIDQNEAKNYDTTCRQLEDSLHTGVHQAEQFLNSRS